jgi:prophage regulatory protein
MNAEHNVTTLAPPRAALRLLRLKEVQARTGLGHTLIYGMEAQGKFPKRVKVTPGGTATAWVEHEVEAWIAGRIAARDAG